jgi:hypothetical protein
VKINTCLQSRKYSSIKPIGSIGYFLLGEKVVRCPQVSHVGTKTSVGTTQSSVSKVLSVGDGISCESSQCIAMK